MVTSSKPLTINTITSSKEFNRRIKASQKKVTMKSKFKNWLRKWVYDEGEVEQPKSLGLVESTELDSSSPMRITIHRAAGGVVIETRTYDRIKDRHNQNLHIVTHDQDLAEGLSKIVTMESLRG